MRWNERRAQATLSFILLVGGIVVEIAIAGAFVAYLASTSSRSERFSMYALAAAHAGIRDAKLNIVRNKEFGGTLGATSTITLEGSIAEVNVSREDKGDYFLYKIISRGTAGTFERKLYTELVVEKRTGIVRSQSFSEIPLSS